MRPAIVHGKLDLQHCQEHHRQRSAAMPRRRASGPAPAPASARSLFSWANSSVSTWKPLATTASCRARSETRLRDRTRRARCACAKLTARSRHRERFLSARSLRFGAGRAMHAADVEAGDLGLPAEPRRGRVERRRSSRLSSRQNGDLRIRRHHSHAAVEGIFAGLYRA